MLHQLTTTPLAAGCRETLSAAAELIPTLPHEFQALND